MIKNSSKPSDGYSESPSTRPMTLRQQQAEKILETYHCEACKLHDAFHKRDVRLKLEALCQEIAREARPNVFRDAKAACSFDLTCKSCVSNSMTLDYLAQPELTQKPPQPLADSQDAEEAQSE